MLYGIKDASNLTVFSQVTGKPILYANYCNTSDITFTADSVYAMMKGVKAIRWDRNKEGGFKTEMEVFDLKWISILLGTSFVTGATPIYKRELLNVVNGVANLADTPTAGSLVIYKTDNVDLLTFQTEQTVGTPATTENKYSIDGTTLTFNTTTTFPDNTGYVTCIYLVNSASTSMTLSVAVDEYPTNYKIIGDTMVRGLDGVDEYVQFELPNVKPKTNLQLNFNVDTPTKLSIEWDIFPDATGNMMDFTVI